MDYKVIANSFADFATQIDTSDNLVRLLNEFFEDLSIELSSLDKAFDSEKFINHTRERYLGLTE